MNMIGGRLTPGMRVKTSRGLVQIRRKLPDKPNAKGVLMARYITSGHSQSFTVPAHAVVHVSAVPAGCTCTTREYCRDCMIRMGQK